jgi:hypothetical protein
MNVPKESKLNAAKEIVVAYIRSAAEKKGEDQKLNLTADDVSSLFSKVYQAIDNTLPDADRKVGLC